MQKPLTGFLACFLVPAFCLVLGCETTSGDGKLKEKKTERIIPSGKARGETTVVHETVVEEVPANEAESRFSDIPVPQGFKLDRSRSFVYEAGHIKAGLLCYEGGTFTMDKIISFYKAEMPPFQWKLTNSFESTDATLYFEKPGWFCRIQIQSSKFRKTDLFISLGPKTAE